MKTMSFDKFNELCEDVTKYDFKPNGWYPKMEEIEKNIEPNVLENLSFIVWILENNELPKTEEEKEIVKKLNKLIENNIEFKD